MRTLQMNKWKQLGTKLFWNVLVIGMLFIVTACTGTANRSALKSLSLSKYNTAGHEIISAYELHKILTEHFGFVAIKLSDAHYTLPDNTKIAQLKGSDLCSQPNSTGKEGWGCDDYAIAAMVPMRNYAFGTMYASAAGGRKQVMNVLVNTNKEVVYWEAQSCQYYQGRFDKPEIILF